MSVKITTAANATAEHSFRLQNNKDTEVYLNYSIKYGSAPGTEVELDKAFLIATPAQVYEGTSVDLTFTTDTVQSAGTYTDTLTFNVTEVVPKS